MVPRNHALKIGYCVKLLCYVISRMTNSNSQNLLVQRIRCISNFRYFTGVLRLICLCCSSRTSVIKSVAETDYVRVSVSSRQFISPPALPAVGLSLGHCQTRNKVEQLSRSTSLRVKVAYLTSQVAQLLTLCNKVERESCSTLLRV